MSMYQHFRNCISVASNCGSREVNEDRVFTNLVSSEELGTLWTLAVMDGHRGEEAVTEVITNLYPELLKALSNNKGDIEAALTEAFYGLNQLTMSIRAGTTLSCAIISENESKAYVAILGDSPVIVIGEDGITLSPEHNVRTNTEEREAAVARGALYEDGFIGLGMNFIQLSRALGDCDLGRILDRNPEIFTVDLDAGSVMILATDGIWRSRANYDEQAFSLTKNLIWDEYTADDFVQGALKHTSDNVSVITWRRNP
ncbi:MAG: PP2C family protein-serine/threonine phosphatase [Candidatus Spechtbacterales bacterium]|nr:PP2C family protein-serine/threonine phosphatase [Candidatus Spechtbacterales bacterium]